MHRPKLIEIFEQRLANYFVQLPQEIALYSVYRLVDSEKETGFYYIIYYNYNVSLSFDKSLLNKKSRWVEILEPELKSFRTRYDSFPAVDLFEDILPNISEKTSYELLMNLDILT